MKELVSVVIPVYNVERYLNRCVESVVNQTYRNLEIILVDDGSPDSCPEMCDEWAGRDNRIRVIHKENAGLGMARNTGLQNVTGQYVCFFDSDDYVAMDLIEHAYHLAKDTNAELTFFGMASVNEEGKIIAERIPRAQQTVYTGQDVRQIVLPDLIHDGSKETKIRNLSMSACSCIYKMDLIRRMDWRFVSERDIISEDSFSLLQLFEIVSSVAILPKVGYYYCHNSNSLTQTYRRDRYEKVCRFYENAINLCDVLGYSDVVRARIGRLYLAFTIGAMKQMVSSPELVGYRIRSIHNAVLDPTLQNVLQGLDRSCYTWKIKLLFLCMRYRWWRLTYILIRLHSRKSTVKG